MSVAFLWGPLSVPLNSVKGIDRAEGSILQGCRSMENNGIDGELKFYLLNE